MELFGSDGRARMEFIILGIVSEYSEYSKYSENSDMELNVKDGD